MIKRIGFIIFLLSLVLLIGQVNHLRVSAAAPNQTVTTSTFTFTIRGGNANDLYDANGNPILKPHQEQGYNVITLDASLSGRSAEVPVGATVFLHFPRGGHDVSITPKGVVEGAKGKYHLPNGDIAILKVVGQGTATIKVTERVSSSKGVKNVASTSNNWSGYARTTGGPFTDITSTWTVPNASSCSSGDTYSSAWAGIDGDGNSNLIQAGTESDCISGSAFYQAWWEILPASETPISNTVNSGDTMFTEIKQNPTNWTITVKDLTQNWTYSTNQSYSGSGASSEWILEAPTVNGSIATLTQYGTDTFSNDTQNGVNPNHTYSTDSIDMLDSNNNTISHVSNPNSLADAFSVEYCPSTGCLTLNPPASWKDISPVGITYDQINGMSASSTSNVWAAGYEQPSGSSKQPVTYLNNGTSWTKYKPTAPCGAFSNHWLDSIATDSSSDAWTVGHKACSNTTTLAYHWTGSWANVTSDNPSSTDSELHSVAIDSSGGAWTTGFYYDGTHNQLLVEKWNGTKFAQQTNISSLPSGCYLNTTGLVYPSVSFSSSSNGWAVGQVSCSPYYDIVIYHYDGTTWTPTASYQSSYQDTALTSVVAVSGSEAWAVGYKHGPGTGSNGVPLILHYTSANGWQEDTSFTSYPNSTALNSVSADSSSDVWIAGRWYNSSTSKFLPYTMHYNGSAWSQVTTPSISGQGLLLGVTANSDTAWAGGYFGTQGTSTPTPLVYMSL